MKGLFGYTSFGDITDTLLGIPHYKLNILMVGILTGITYILGYVWDSPEPIFVLWTMMAFDFIAGVSVAVKKKTFSSHRLPRMLVQLFTTTILLGIAFNMSKANIFFNVIPPILLGGFYSVYLVSLVENMSELGWIRGKDIVKLIKRRFGIKRIMNDEI